MYVSSWLGVFIFFLLTYLSESINSQNLCEDIDRSNQNINIVVEAARGIREINRSLN